jgi:hypothetical protein
LKAAIFDEEQKLAYRNQNKSSRLRSQRGAKSGDKKDIFAEQNKGIQERNLRDEKVEMKVKSQKHVNASLVSKVCHSINLSLVALLVSMFTHLFC